MNGFDRDHRQVQAVLDALAGPDRDALLAHLRQCGECTRALAGVQDALLAALYLPPPSPMDAARQHAVRLRLMARAETEPAAEHAPEERAPRRAAAVLGGTGWLVAAGLSTMLLTHHAFHRPLRLGWIVAAVLGMILFGTLTYLLTERRRSAALRDRLSDLEAELARVRSHALGGERILGTA